MARILTVKELSDYLKLSDLSICRLASSGKLPGFKIGDSWQFDMDEILELINEVEGVIRENGAMSQCEGQADNRDKYPREVLGAYD